MEQKQPQKSLRKERTEKSAAWLVIVIIASVVLAAVILTLRYNESNFKYKGYDVKKVTPKGTTATFYVVKVPIRIYGTVNNYYLFLRNDPRELEGLEVEGTAREVLLDPKPEKVYLTHSPDMQNISYVGLAMLQVSNVIGVNGIFGIPTTGAVTREISGRAESANLTKTCADSSEKVLVIEFRYAEKNRIYVDERGWRCVIIEGKDKDELIKAADKTVLALLGL
ncbi:MAG TPA: hypothetical protein HA282_02050 [Nanoarchaeota archaeon]|nr:MAG: hypothetical protein QT01_C0002G0086 [archaeon GW2011_AR6]MBS3082678.1 hypothetical protein [Candidatus Pacearchaeota archaeon]HIH18220.1 hypothetical protein [Nanoarchaeota archaeon]HIH34335.1 hypothetical protein [Nanoarchaeota archaeon]HIH50908.1 hypothetical protein [Nanoarchaeota archaeon]